MPTLREAAASASTSPTSGAAKPRRRSLPSVLQWATGGRLSPRRALGAVSDATTAAGQEAAGKEQLEDTAAAGSGNLRPYAFRHEHAGYGAPRSSPSDQITLGLPGLGRHAGRISSFTSQVSNARSAAGGRSARIGGARKKEREKNERECSGCGTCTTDTKSRFCTTCGQELEMPRVCSGCEEVLLPGDTFCARCGCKSGPQRGGTVSAFEVHAPWKLSPLESKSLLRAGSRHSLRSLSTENLLQEGQGTSRITLNPSGMQMAKTEMNKMILHPSSGPRLIWDMLTMIFVSYDVIVLPLAFLEMETPPAMDGMSWLLRVFWSVDLICAFFTGYHDRDGKLQMSVVKVGKHYLRTWFCMDLGLVLIDWLTVLLKTQAKAASIARLGKTVRAARMLRMARALRLTRVIAEVSPSVEYYLRSEMSVVVLGVTRVMLVMALISHFLACSWYGLGASGGPEAVTWLKVGDYDQLDVGSGYAIALHWSLTQFIGSMEVNPVSTGERMFNVGVLMFAFLALCVLPAKITSLMTQFQITAAERSQALSQLSQFLYDQRVSRYLTLRLVRAANSAMLVQSRKTPEDKIVLLGLISDTLKMELHYEMYCRPESGACGLQVGHPFFRRLQDKHVRIMQKICHHAISPMDLTDEDVLFNAGEIPERPAMYVLLDGQLKYSHQPIWEDDSGHSVNRTPSQNSLKVPSARPSVNSDASSLVDVDAADRQSHNSATMSPNVKLLQRFSFNSISEQSENMEFEAIDSPMVMCEGALWTRWVHHGTMLSTSCASLLVVDAADLMKTKDKMPPAIMRACCKYAEAYVTALNKLPVNAVTDLENFDVDLMAHEAFDAVTSAPERTLSKTASLGSARFRGAY